MASWKLHFHRLFVPGADMAGFIHSLSKLSDALSGNPTQQ